MTIRNLDTYVNQLWDWGFLDECFRPTRIKITDIDGLVERNGRFLLIEAKSPGKDVPTGQRILFDNLTKSERWHVLVLWGEPNSPEHYKLWGHTDVKPTDTSEIQSIIRRWFEWASKQPKKIYS